MQDYNAENAYQRWRGSLGFHLAETRGLIQSCGFPRFPDAACWSDSVTRNPLTKLAVYNFGRVVWGVFARAFWAIYRSGRNNHYGTVVLGFDSIFEDSSALFGISQDLRTLREGVGEPEFLETFARQIRDDTKGRNRIRIPKELSCGRAAYFQLVYVPRTRLPCGYLHHRLVPVIAHPASSYACILPLEFWPADFKRKWLEGEPPLSAERLALYQQAFPNVQP